MDPKHRLERPADRMGVRLLIAIVVVAVLAGGFFGVSRGAPTGGLAALAAGVAWVVVATAGFAWMARRDRGALASVLGAAVVTALVGGYLIRPQGNEVDEEIVTAEPAAAAKPPRAVKPAPAVNPARAAKPPRAAKPAPAAKPTETAEPAGAAAPPEPAQAAEPPAAKPAADPEPREASQPPAPRGNVQLSSGQFSGESGHRGQGTAAVVELADGRRTLTFSRFDVDPGAGGLRVYLTAGRPGSDGEVEDFVDLAGLKGTKGDQQYEVPRDVDLRRYSTVVIWCVPFTTRIAQATLS